MIEQGTPEWFAQRNGKITASKIADVMAGGKGITRAKYAAQLAAERLTGKPARGGFTSAAMEHGTETEPIARMRYELKNGVMVVESEFVQHPFIWNSGASPDGLVDDDGLLEIKCPETHTFLEYLLTGEIPSKYQLQMLWQIACTKRKWCDFVAFDPDLPEQDGYLQIRYAPSVEKITEIEREIYKFDLEVEALVQSIIDKRGA